jgi:hypothetical protein
VVRDFEEFRALFEPWPGDPLLGLVEVAYRKPQLFLHRLVSRPCQQVLSIRTMEVNHATAIRPGVIVVNHRQ